MESEQIKLGVTIGKSQKRDQVLHTKTIKKKKHHREFNSCPIVTYNLYIFAVNCNSKRINQQISSHPIENLLNNYK